MTDGETCYTSTSRNTIKFSPNLQSSSPIFIIDTPSKIWRPKQKQRYIPTVHDDVDEGFFEFKKYGKAVFKPEKAWDKGERTDVILYNEIKHNEELEKSFKCGALVCDSIKGELKNLVKKYWDCFCDEGTRRPVIGYEFSIDTGASPPVCCPQPRYGFRETRVMDEQIETLCHNDWVYRIASLWGALIVLAPKPHQEHIQFILDFIWRLCVSYRPLNKVTLPFFFPIPRCDDATEFHCSGTLYQAKIDAKQGYHQVAVKKSDQTKLAFWGPRGEKWTWKVMPFGPTNAPPFYSAMMSDLKKQWDTLFIEEIQKAASSDVFKIKFVSATQIFFNNVRLDYGSNIIIDDTLLWSNILRALLMYLECALRVFVKHRLTLRLSKCEFLSDRMEFLGRDITRDGNLPAESKFDMIKGWPIPTTGRILHSFIGLINFYCNWVPYFELRIKPLRALEKSYHHKAIPFMAWSPQLLELFTDLKQAITSSPCLARFNPSIPCFLKSDWSSLGCGLTLMQPAEDSASQAALDKFRLTGECDFDLSEDGPRLKPIAYDSRACSDGEKSLHSLTGEVMAGRWAMAKCRRYLWGSHFGWLCDCIAVKKIDDYEGPLHCMRRWRQELHAYDYTCFHRTYKMMYDVDALTRMYSPEIAKYATIAFVLSKLDEERQPAAYKHEEYDRNPVKVTVVAEQPNQTAFCLTSSFLNFQVERFSHNSSAAKRDDGSRRKQVISSLNLLLAQPADKLLSLVQPVFSSHQSLFVNAGSIAVMPTEHTTTATSLNMSHSILSHHVVNWITVDNVLSNPPTMEEAMPPPLQLNLVHVYTNERLSDVFQLRHPNQQYSVAPISSWVTINDSDPEHSEAIDLTAFSTGLASVLQQQNVHGMDWTYPSASPSYVVTWSRLVSKIISLLTTDNDGLQAVFLWFPIQAVQPGQIFVQCKDEVEHYLQDRWSFSFKQYNCARFGNNVAAIRYVIHLDRTLRANGGIQRLVLPNYPVLDPSASAINNVLDASANRTATASSIIIPSNSFLKTDATQLSSALPVPLAAIKHPAILAPSPNPCNFVLDPRFPATEPCLEADGNAFFGRRFGVPFRPAKSSFIHARTWSNKELCRSFLTNSTEADLVAKSLTESDLDDLLYTSTPEETTKAVMKACFNHSILPQFTHADVYHSTDVGNCLMVKQLPSDKTWKDGYMSDPSLKIILEHLISNPGATWTEEELTSVDRRYHEDLINHRVILKNNKLMQLKTVCPASKFLATIIVPPNLRRLVFTYYHSSAMAGHLRFYKTLHRLRMRFYWPKMRKDVEKWIKECAECNAQNVWQQRRKELWFSWPVTAPFAIMHLDFWSPGDVIDEDGNTCLLNCMDDLTQFVIVIESPPPTALSAARLFMERVVLLFGTPKICVVDADSLFKDVFKEMCTILDLVFWELARGNHKGCSVEKFHRVLNKGCTIEGTKVGGNTNFVKQGKTVGFAWNSAPHDNTEITRSFSAIGINLTFPLDTKLCENNAQFNDSRNSELFDYIRHVSADRKFAQDVLKILVEERREYHRLRHNSDKTILSPFKVGDVVKAHVQVKSDKSAGVVGKLSYQARGPFLITKDLGFNSFEVRPYDNPSGATRKYKAEQLYLLPPALFPSEALDTTEQRYLNISHAPIVHPLKQSMKIESYNARWFTNPPPSSAQPTSIHSPRVDKEFFSNDNDDTELEEELSETQPKTARELFEKVNLSKDKLFFVRYIPEFTQRARWYLVQVDLESTNETNCDPGTSGKYYCVFFMKHPNDIQLSDELSRWWPEWHKFTYNSTNPDEILYGDRVLIRPGHYPDSSKYIQWATILPLASNNCQLLGPFDFKPLNADNNTHCLVPLQRWKDLTILCKRYGLQVPSVGPNAPVSTVQMKLGKRKNIQ